MQKDLIGSYSGAVPRYTSYPTAPHFHAAIDASVYSGWLQMLGAGQDLSLYLHIPYCDRLCWFCACHTKHTLKYEPLLSYLSSLKQEIESVGNLVSKDCTVTSLHFGGGSPTMLRPQDMIDLVACLRAHFHFSDSVEISVEMDPNDLDSGRYDALAAIGMTRASLGVQDFDPKVQQAINRIQTFEQTRDAVRQVRARGVSSVNCDVLYGLPYQTLETMRETVSAIISLDPDRIALFGYAHVPWMKKHQTMIPQDALPDLYGRFAQMQQAAGQLLEAGYRQIGIDHFAKPDDGLAISEGDGSLKRNFQGYTNDTAQALIGFGASSIGQLPQGYVQNQPSTAEYRRMVEDGGLAIVRGIALDDADRLRAYAIERVMCDFALDFADLQARFGDASGAVMMEAKTFVAKDRHGLCSLENGRFVVSQAGKPFARAIAATFDHYLANGKGRHSVAV